jgi:predicted phosphodiesterase
MIWFLGDNHGRFDYIAKAIDAAPEKPSAIVLLGDLEAPNPLQECMRDVESRGVRWHWIFGNHDTDSIENYANISELESLYHNIDGIVVKIDGVRVAGLGGVFRGAIWYPPDPPKYANYAEYERAARAQCQLKQRPSKLDRVQNQAVPPELRHWDALNLDHSRTGKLLKHRSTIFPEQFDQLARQQADILVTHEAPSCHPHGFSEIDRLARVMGVQAIFHGHHHDSRDYTSAFELMGFKSYGVGFRGITDIDGHAIRTGAPWA